MWHKSPLITVLTLCMGLLASSASAQEAVESRCIGTTAQELFAHGQDSYAVGHYDIAVDCWQRAYALDARPLIQFNLAQVLERLGRLDEAAAALESYVRSSTREDPRHAEANARLASLRNRLASTGFRLTGGPDGGTITVDGQAWGATPRPDPISMRSGSHVIEIAYPDGRRFRSTVVAVAGQVLDIPIREEDLSAAPTVVEIEVPAEVEDPGHTMLFIGIGAAAVGAGVLSYGIERSITVSDCADPYYCRDLDQGKLQRTLGLALGSTFLAGGAALIVFDLIRDRPEAAPVACAPTGLGGICRITF